MQQVTAASLVKGQGIEDNANFGGRRQVTIIEKETGSFCVLKWVKIWTLPRVELT